MEFSLNTLWTTLSSGKVNFRRKTACTLNVAINSEDGDCDASIDISGDILDMANKDMLWMFTAYTCACCGLRERYLHCESNNVETAKENFHTKYNHLKSVEVGSDVRRVGRIELAFRDGDILSVGLECSCEQHQREFQKMAKCLVKLGNLESCKSCGCNTRRRTSSGESSNVDANCGTSEEADRHMRELLEITEIEETANAKSGDRKKMKKKSGKAVRSKTVHIAAEVQPTLKAGVPAASDDDLRPHALQQNSCGADSNKRVGATLVDTFELAASALNSECQVLATSANSDQEAPTKMELKETSANMELKAGDSCTAVSVDMAPTGESWTIESRGALTSDASVNIEAHCATSEEADCHMRELVEITEVEGTAHGRSMERKRMRKKTGKAVKLHQMLAAEKIRRKSGTRHEEQSRKSKTGHVAAEAQPTSTTDVSAKIEFKAGQSSTIAPDDTLPRIESWATVSRRKTGRRSAVSDFAVHAYDAATAKECCNCSVGHEVATLSSTTSHDAVEATVNAESPQELFAADRPQKKDAAVQTMAPTMTSCEALHQKDNTVDMETQTEPHEEHVGDYMLDESTPTLWPMKIEPRVHRATCVLASPGEPAKIERQKVPSDMFACRVCDDCDDIGEGADSEGSTICCREGCCDDASLTDWKLLSDESACWSLAHEVGESVLYNSWGMWHAALFA